MAKRPKAERKAAETGLLVDRPESLAISCARAIENALQQKNLRFDKQPSRGDKILFTLFGPGATNAKAKYTYKVIPLAGIGSGSKNYWLAASLEFQSELRKVRVASASLFVFEGEINDNNKNALLRAEWACLPSDITSKHAQPHWHIYPSQLEKDKQNLFEYKNKVEVQEFMPDFTVSSVRDFGSEKQTSNIQNDSEEVDDWKKSQKFHFAMSSRWQDHETILNKPPVDGCLPIWLEGCVKYTVEQLIYIYKTKIS